MTDLPPPSSEPAPPSDLEEQAAAIRNAAEAAAIGLFATSAVELSAADLRLIEQIASGLAITLTEKTLDAARAAGGAALVLAIARDVAKAAVTPAALTDLGEMAINIRRSLGKTQPAHVGNLSPSRQAARNWATAAYAYTLEHAVPFFPDWTADGLVLKKTWVSQGDSRVRPLHRRLHGRTVPYTGDFWRWPATGQSLRFPGDPLAPPDAVIGCRCLVWLSWSAPGELSKAVRTLPPMEELP